MDFTVRLICPELANIGAQVVKHLLHIERQVMATKQEVIDAVAAEAQEVKDRVDALDASVVALKEQVAAGTAASEADFDEIIAGVRNIFTPTPPEA